jgi:HEAT repeat protein
MTAEEKAEIEKLIASLGDENWQVRNEATQKLATFGKKAKTLLELAAETTEDEEVKHRVALVLKAVFPPCVRVRPDED